VQCLRCVLQQLRINMIVITGNSSVLREHKMSGRRKCCLRKLYRARKRYDDQKKKSEAQMEGFGSQADYSQEKCGDWLWLSSEMPAQCCRRLDARQRRLNSELLRAIEEVAVQRVAR
jgi:hypothetical protein